MSETRLYSPVPLQAAQSIDLHDEQARYLLRALRLRVGDQLTLFDGHGGEYPATIVAAGKNRVSVETGEMIDTDRESTLSIHLVQGVAKGDRMDTVVQKATELGVNRITPVISDYSVVKFDERRSSRRLEHWRKIAQSACEQCGRNRVPGIEEPLSLLAWFGSGAASGGLILKPDAGLPLSAARVGDREVLVLIGPEGGFSDKEYENAGAANMTAVSLGPRILRTETAGPAALAILQSIHGDLSPKQER